MTFKVTEYPLFSWSSSRKSTFKECRRKYYFNYYLSHNGWMDDAGEEAKQAYRLKKLTGIHLLLGSAIHEVAEYAAKILKSTGSLPAQDKLIEKVRFLLNSAWKESQQPELWKKSPNSYLMLHGFYYGNGLSESLIKKIKDKLYTAIPNILNSSSFKEISEAGGDCVEITEGMDTFKVSGIDIYAVPDLAYRRPSGKWVVTDWKTGKKQSSHADQIYVYCLYLAQKMGVSPDNIAGRIEYLISGDCREIKVDASSLEMAKKEITGSIKEMKSELKDPERNIPFEKERYPLTGQRRFCRYCNYYELCKKELGDSV
ncbi:MAG: PD-(D/E)XK nuclease family protein [Elusimicrobiota bacterium]